MNEALATTVLLIGILLGMVVNYWAWSLIVAVRRRARARRLARPDGPPSDGAGTRGRSEDIAVGTPR